MAIVGGAECWKLTVHPIDNRQDAFNVKRLLQFDTSHYYGFMPSRAIGQIADR
jgi:hypothetical protein